MNVGKQKIVLGCYTDASHPNGLKILELDEVLGLNYDRDAGTFKTVATLGGLFRPASLLERVVP